MPDLGKSDMDSKQAARKNRHLSLRPGGPLPRGTLRERGSTSEQASAAGNRPVRQTCGKRDPQVTPDLDSYQTPKKCWTSAGLKLG